MMNEKDILARLQAGENAQDIANEMVAALNAANAAYIQEQEAKAKAEAEANAVEAELNDLAQMIADAVLDYIDLAAPEVLEDEDEDALTGAQVRELMDAMLPMMVSMKKLAALTSASDKPHVMSMKITPHAPSSDDAAISEFLNKFVN